MKNNFLPVVAVVGAIVLAFYLIYVVFRPATSAADICLQALPQNQRVGIKIETHSDKSVSIDLSGQRGTPNGATPEQIAEVARCVVETTKAPQVNVVDGDSLQLLPVGEVANTWNHQGGLKLTLMPSSHDDILSNLGIGPAAGFRDRIVRDWCKRLAGCVTCEPTEIAPTTPQVLVRLREDAPVEKRQMWGNWPPPQPNALSQPWQIVNGKGQRFYYECVSTAQTNGQTKAPSPPSDTEKGAHP